jgi:hypothetical protein
VNKSIDIAIALSNIKQILNQEHSTMLVECNKLVVGLHTITPMGG